MSTARAARALLVLSLIFSVFAAWLIAPSPTPPPMPSQPPVVEAAAAPVSDARSLPNEVSMDQEIVDRRSAHSATFRVDADTYTTIVSAEALHYRDEHGVWQPIDPAFRSRGDSFVVEHNSIPVVLIAAWVSAVDHTAVIWKRSS
jgi:hypothetical protein